MPEKYYKQNGEPLTASMPEQIPQHTMRAPIGLPARAYAGAPSGFPRCCAALEAAMPRTVRAHWSWDSDHARRFARAERARQRSARERVLDDI